MLDFRQGYVSFAHYSFHLIIQTSIQAVMPQTIDVRLFHRRVFVSQLLKTLARFLPVPIPRFSSYLSDFVQTLAKLKVWL